MEHVVPHRLGMIDNVSHGAHPVPKYFPPGIIITGIIYHGVEELVPPPPPPKSG